MPAGFYQCGMYRNVVTVRISVIIGAWVFAKIPKLALVFVAVLLSIVACEVYFDDDVVSCL